MDPNDVSFSSEDGSDISTVVCDSSNDDDDSTVVPINKKLEDCFDNLASKPSNSHLRVFLRVRPVSDSTESTMTSFTDTCIVTTAPNDSKRAKFTKLEERNYSFNRVFGPGSDQSEIFDQAVEPSLNRFIRGENCVLFAYGMTNSGKTHTIQGSHENPGCLPKIVLDVMSQIRSLNGSSIQMAIMEIYLDDAYDLLSLSKKKEKLKLRDGNGNVFFEKLTQTPITSIIEAFELMNKASYNR